MQGVGNDGFTVSDVWTPPNRIAGNGSNGGQSAPSSLSLADSSVHPKGVVESGESDGDNKTDTCGNETDSTASTKRSRNEGNVDASEMADEVAAKTTHPRYPKLNSIGSDEMEKIDHDGNRISTARPIIKKLRGGEGKMAPWDCEMLEEIIMACTNLEDEEELMYNVSNNISFTLSNRNVIAMACQVMNVEDSDNVEMTLVQEEVDAHSVGAEKTAIFFCIMRDEHYHDTLMTVYFGTSGMIHCEPTIAYQAYARRLKDRKKPPNQETAFGVRLGEMHFREEMKEGKFQSVETEGPMYGEVGYNVKKHSNIAAPARRQLEMVMDEMNRRIERNRLRQEELEEQAEENEGVRDPHVPSL
jgi:hypothetical protein